MTQTKGLQVVARPKTGGGGGGGEGVLGSSSKSSASPVKQISTAKKSGVEKGAVCEQSVVFEDEGCGGGSGSGSGSGSGGGSGGDTVTRRKSSRRQGVRVVRPGEHCSAFDTPVKGYGEGVFDDEGDSEDKPLAMVVKRKK